MGVVSGVVLVARVGDGILIAPVRVLEAGDSYMKTCMVTKKKQL